MASKLANDDLLTCPICFEHFNRPKSLPCSHTFCYQCLRSYIISQLGGEGKKAGPFSCPVCRQEVPILDPSLTSEKIADALPGNHLITSLIDRAESSGDGKRERQCDPCNYDNRKIPAVMWCTVCLEGMCQNCTSCHKGMKTSRSHKTLPITDVPDDPSGMPLLEVDEPCLKHTGKILEVYCSDHKQMCCVLCLATNHRECKNISTLEEMVSGSENVESVEDFSCYLKQVDQKTEEVKVKTENNIKSLDTRQGEISQKVSDVVQKAKDKLDQLKTDFETNLQQKHKEQSAKLTERKERIEIFQSCVKRADKLLDAVRKQGSPRQLFVTKEKIKMQLHNQMESLRDHLEDVDHVDYKLKLVDAVILVSESLTSIADLEISNTTGDLRDNVRGILEILARLCNKEPETVDITKITATQLTRLCNKQPETVDITKITATKVCKIGSTHYGGGTFLPDGRLVLCSVTQQALQAYDKDGTQLFEIQLNKEPRDACIVSPSEVIVSFPYAGCLTKFEVTQDKFISKNSFKCENGTWGVDATKDCILVGHSFGVDMYSLDGKFIRTISRLSDNYMYTHIATSMPGIVCFCNHNDVVSVTFDGKELSRFNSPELYDIFGVAVDKYKNIFVCGCYSSNVCVFSSDGKSHRALIENIKAPNGIGFNSQGRQFFIATAKGVFLYDIKYH